MHETLSGRARRERVAGLAGQLLAAGTLSRPAKQSAKQQGVEKAQEHSALIRH
jgi:hypothetical protein